MREITQRLIGKFRKDFESIAEEMAKEGMDSFQIAIAFDKYLRAKQQSFYRTAPPMQIGDVLKIIAPKVPTSKAEHIFYDLLKREGIKFDYQYPIGKYTADFLVADSVVIELDGPDHIRERDEIRDYYLRKMGYKVVRVPLVILFHSPKAVIAEIKAITMEG